MAHADFTVMTWMSVPLFNTPFEVNLYAVSKFSAEYPPNDFIP
jgi:hypothetical protein